MDYQATETIILNDEEFILLLAAAGVRDWYGIDIGKKAEFINDEGSVNRVLAGLYRKGMIDWGQEKARISDTARPVMKILKEAPVCIMCESMAAPGLISGSYCSDGRVVMIERSIAGDGELRLTAMSAKEWYSFFEKGGFFPKVIRAPEDMDPDKLLPETGDKVTDFMVRSIPEGRMLENVMLYDCGVYGMIIDNTTRNSTRKMYSPDEMRSIIYSWAGGASE